MRSYSRCSHEILAKSAMSAADMLTKHASYINGKFQGNPSDDLKSPTKTCRKMFELATEFGH